MSLALSARRTLACLLVAAMAACAGTIAPTEPAPLVARVMTFNLRWDGFDDGANAWRHRLESACGTLDAFAPDSVGTQEPMPRQIADVEAALPWIEGYRFDNHPDFPRTQQILYRNDRFDRTGQGGFLVADGDNVGGTIRYCTWVRLTDRASGRSYFHYNVHLDHRHLPSREQSVVRLMRHIAAREPADPFVVTGDFNTSENSTPMRFLRGEIPLPDDDGAPVPNPIPLVDTFRVLFPDAREVGTGSGFHGKRRSGGKIDHVLVEAGAATVHSAEIVRTPEAGRYPSDHFPVTAVIRWD